MALFLNLDLIDNITILIIIETILMKILNNLDKINWIMNFYSIIIKINTRITILIIKITIIKMINLWILINKISINVIIINSIKLKIIIKIITITIIKTINNILIKIIKIIWILMTKII